MYHTLPCVTLKKESMNKKICRPKARTAHYCNIHTAPYHAGEKRNTDGNRKKIYSQTAAGNLARYDSHLIEQGYLNTNPVVRVRREDDTYYLTYKGKGLMAREEYNLPLNEQAYNHLVAKADGNIITKRRYLIPLPPYTIELDVFMEPFAPLVIAEVEFPTEKEAEAFIPPEWFLEDVTFNPEYHNSTLSTKQF